MQPTIETAAAQHIWNVPMLTHILTGQTKVSFEIQHRYDRRSHHFRICHLALHIFTVLQGFEHVIAQTKNDYNLRVHEFLLYIGGRDTPNVMQTHGLFYPCCSW